MYVGTLHTIKTFFLAIDNIYGVYKCCIEHFFPKIIVSNFFCLIIIAFDEKLVSKTCSTIGSPIDESISGL